MSDEVRIGSVQVAATDGDRVAAVRAVLSRWQPRSRDRQANRLFHEMAKALTLGQDIPLIGLDDNPGGDLPPEMSWLQVNNGHHGSHPNDPAAR